MEIVKTVKRINALNEAIKRVDWLNGKYDEILDKLFDKKDSLISDLKSYKAASNDRKERLRKRNNIKLACKLLKFDYYSIIK